MGACEWHDHSKKALALEKNIGTGGIAILMIPSEGKARIKDIIPNEERIEQLFDL